MKRIFSLIPVVYILIGSLSLEATSQKEAVLVSESPKKFVKILSLDGGGVRGVLEAVLLEELQKLLKRPIAHHFDIVGGTSTGSILAASISKRDHTFVFGEGDLGVGVEDEKDSLADTHYKMFGKPLYAPKEVTKLYEERGGDIFKRSYWHMIQSLWGWIGPKYQAYGFENLLKEKLGDDLMSDCITNTVITAARGKQPFIIKSSKADRGCTLDPTGDSDKRNFKVRDAVRGSSAAPTYFEPAYVQNRAGSWRTLEDGGMVANNPLDVVALEGATLFPKVHSHLLVSVGTGVSKECERKRIEDDEDDVAPSFYAGGLLGWAGKIINVLFGASAAKTEHLGRKLAEIEGRGHEYYRFNFVLDNDHMEMDDVSEENIKYLKQAAQKTIRTKYKDKLQELADILNAHPRLEADQDTPYYRTDLLESHSRLHIADKYGNGINLEDNY